MIPHVSIIVPVYNVEKYLRQCLDSLINQTLKEIEIICINDGSTDNSLQILEEYAKKDGRIKVINEKNVGQGAARNNGMERATGEYIGFVDSDDWVDITMFEKLYKNAKYHDSDMVMCLVNVFDENSQGLRYDKPYFALECFNKNFNKNVFDHTETKDFFFHICVTVFNKIYRTSFLKKINAKFPEDLIFEDNPFFYKTYLSATKVSLIRDFLYFYRINRPNSTISNVDKRFFDLIKIQNLNKEIFLETNNFDDYKMNLFNYTISSLFNRYFQVPKSYRQEFFDLIKEYLKCMGLKDCELNDLRPYNKNIYLDVMSSQSYKEFELREEKTHLSSEINQLTSELNEIKKILNEYLTTKGYLKYKSKNIATRINNRIKNYKLIINKENT